MKAKAGANILVCPHENISLAKNPFTSYQSCLEIVLGGWGNTKSVIRQRRKILSVKMGSVLDEQKFVNLVLDFSGQNGNIYKNGEILLELKNWKNYLTKVDSIGISTGWGIRGDWTV